MKFPDIRQELLYELLQDKITDLGELKVFQVFNTIQNEKRPTQKIKYIPFSKLEKKADDVFAKHIRNRDKTCITCGTIHKGTNSHLFRRGRQSTRFNEYCNNRQCEPCNALHNTDSEPYKQWFIKKYGEEKYLEVEQLSWTIKKWTREELEEIIATYA